MHVREASFDDELSRSATNLYVVLPEFTVEAKRLVFSEMTERLSKPRGVESMKTKLLVAVFVMALLVCGAVMISYAQGPEGMGHGGWGGPGHGMAFWGRELNLTDAQKAQIKTIMQANHASMKTVAQQMLQNRANLLAATANGAYDPATVQKIQTLANNQAALEATMIVNREAIQHQIYTQVLTADQQAKAEQLRTQEITRINEHLQKMANGTDTPPPPPTD
jgi:periplasmic protein CpxP/Spy